MCISKSLLCAFVLLSFSAEEYNVKKIIAIVITSIFIVFIAVIGLYWLAIGIFVFTLLFYLIKNHISKAFKKLRVLNYFLAFCFIFILSVLVKVFILEFIFNSQ